MVVDMNVFLAVDDNGDKLATRAKFWKEATDEMKAVDIKVIRQFLRAHGWVRKEINAAERARREVIKSIERNAKKKRDHEAAIKNIDMNVFLAVDDNGDKLATRAKFWKEATDEMKAVDIKVIRQFLRDNGWAQKEINAAEVARQRCTPAGRKATNESNRKSMIKRLSTPAGRKKKRESGRKSMRKVLSTPFGRLMHNARRATHHACKAFGMKKTGKTNRYLKCTYKELEIYFSTFMKPNIRIGVYDYLTHDKDPVYQIDHGVPRAIVAKNQHIEGLVDFCISYKNQRPIDARFNQLKGDAIILELVHPDCPALPFINSLNGVDRIFQTVDEFLAFKGVARSDFPLL